MSDYELELKVKNGRFLQTMRELGYGSIPKLSKACGIGYTTLLDMANIKSPALSANGEIRPSVVELMEFFGCQLTDIYPEKHLYEAMEKNTFIADVSAADIGMICGGASHTSDPLELLEQEESFEDNLSEFLDHLGVHMTIRERRVLESRYGDNKSLTECAEELGVSRERIRQIECKGLRRLRRRDNKELIMDGAGQYLEVIKALQD